MNGLETVTYIIIPWAMVLMVLVYLLFNIERFILCVKSNYIEDLVYYVFNYKIYFKKDEENSFRELIWKYNWNILEDNFFEGEIIWSYYINEKWLSNYKQYKKLIFQMREDNFEWFKKDLSLVKV